MNEELYRALEQISDDHINEAATHQKKRRFLWLKAIAAVLAIIIAWTAVWGELGFPATIITPTTTTSTEPHLQNATLPSDTVTPTGPDISHGGPASYFYFESVSEIKGLISAAERNDQEYVQYVHSMAFHPYTEVSVLRESTNNLEQFLNTVPLPYIDGKFSALRYYYEGDTVELFMDVNGIRYQFLIGLAIKEISGTLTLTDVQMGDLTLNLYENEGRLYGFFTKSGYQFCISIFTSDPSEVDLSAFSFKTLLDTQTNHTGPIVVPLSGLVAEPVYPEMVTHPYLPGGGTWQEWRAQYDQPEGYADSLNDYFKETIASFLTDTDEENAAYSPLNVYMALAMLAETTGGESRQQILDLLGTDSIEALRTQAGYVWNAHYCDDGATTSVLANSLWLDGAPESYYQDAIDTLAKDYYASVFCGELGSDEMNRTLQNWLNEQTGGLLKEHVQNEELTPDTVFALASTVYYRVKWSNSFNKKANTQDIFHGTDGDTTVTYMNDSYDGLTYYYGDTFGAVALELEDEGQMWLILPDESCTPQQLLSDGECLDMVLGEWKQRVSATVNLSLPKFDISSKQNLKEKLVELGVTDVFSSNVADFTPLLGETEKIAVSGVDHAVRVAIDEEGITAAAYTLIPTAGSMPPEPGEEIDFILDRPFLFVITSRDDLPLFAGVVEQP